MRPIRDALFGSSTGASTPILFGSAVLTVCIGLILSSATSSIIVFAQELMPHRFGMISGVFFGVAFGIGGLGAAGLGKLADGIRLRTTTVVFDYDEHGLVSGSRAS